MTAQRCEVARASFSREHLETRLASSRDWSRAKSAPCLAHLAFGPVQSQTTPPEPCGQGKILRATHPPQPSPRRFPNHETDHLSWRRQLSCDSLFTRSASPAVALTALLQPPVPRPRARAPTRSSVVLYPPRPLEEDRLPFPVAIPCFFSAPYPQSLLQPSTAERMKPSMQPSYFLSPAPSFAPTSSLPTARPAS